MEGNIFGEVAYDQTYPLYVDLHAYTSGLERLRKLVLACDGFMKEGSFSPVRGYSHRIDELLDAVGSLDLSGYRWVESKHLRRQPRDQQGHRKRRGSRGGRPVSYDPVDYKNRNVIERGFCRLKQWRGLATRYDKLAIVYRAAVVLNAVIAWVHQLQDTP